MTAYNGSVEFSWTHGTWRFRFTYARLAELQERFGDDGYLDHVARALDERRVTDIIQLAALASGKSQEEVEQASPPIVPMTGALLEAWKAAWYGPDAIPEATEGKETALAALLSGRLWKALSGAGQAGATSGT